jgi:hypothetical protein
VNITLTTAFAAATETVGDPAGLSVSRADRLDNYRPDGISVVVSTSTGAPNRGHSQRVDSTSQYWGSVGPWLVRKLKPCAAAIALNVT